MRLAILDKGHSTIQKIQIALVRKMMGGFVPGPILIQSYRADFFGKPFNDAVEIALRGASEWNKKETELFAAFVSKNNRCQFCLEAHTAVAAKGTDQAVIEAVLTDWQTAPVNEKVRATLGFLEKLTRTPQQMTPEDLEPILATGVSRQGIEEAIRICFVFCTINRLADAFDFELAVENQRSRMGFMLYNFGYGIAALPG